MAEDEVEAEEVDSTYPTMGIKNFSKKTEANEEPLQEGGASMRNKVGKPCHLRATIAMSCLSALDRCVSRVGTTGDLD